MANKKQGYEFTDEDIKQWSRHLTTDINNPIGRAWARCIHRGYRLGSPISESEKLGNVNTQDFQYCYGQELEDDVNESVSFYDARGLIVTESGLD